MTRFNSTDSDPRSGDVPYPDGWEDLLVSYALGDLSPQEEVDLQQLLKNYPELAPEAKAYQTSWESLPLALPEQTVPDALEARVLSAAQSTPQQYASPQQTEATTTGAQPLTYPVLTQLPLSEQRSKGQPSTLSLPRSGVSASASPHQASMGRLTDASPAYTPKTQVRRVRPSRSRTQSRVRQQWQPWGGAIAAALLAAV
ncbi:MAG: hypothetical protein AAFP03_10780, partial [Cyanobacteria bacterium J06598_3]